ncbi:MAG: hypothetical protein CVU36_02000 [Betaproteobacteria bacterium HGW-Betaproteobacteria-9]|jgi:hypothetical protein|nr:MAG: hypothetical protein CVU36_02000 [Betaproteobacteria bacterium HGW-Betaproteobacteria-9]
MKRVVLHIDRLVLRGFDRADQAGIAEGLRAELGRLLATPQAAQALVAQRSVARLKVAPLPIAPGAQATAVGEQTAQSIVRGISS